MVRRTLAEAAIALFAAWHAFAVGIVAIPADARDPLSSWIRREWLPVVWLYVTATSQWQKWDLFSPDPPQDVITYAIEVAGEEGWRTLERIEPWHVPLGRRAAAIGLLEHMLEDSGDAARIRFLVRACRDHALPEGAQVHLLRRLAMLSSSFFETSVVRLMRCPPLR